jgi:hypothetical protein
MKNLKNLKGCNINTLSQFGNHSNVSSGAFGQCQSYPFRGKK